MTENSTSPMNVALTFGSTYAAHAGVVIASAIRFLPPGSARFLCLHDGVDQTCKDRIEATAAGFEIVWREVTSAEMPDMPPKGHLNRLALFRLGLGKFAPPDWTKVLYLDSDMIVQDDLRKVWTTDLGGLPIGAVVDVYQDGSALRERFHLDPTQENLYFNAGMLLIDLNAERKSHDFEASLALLIDQNFDFEFLDQDVLNLKFWNRWKQLDPAWNVQRYLSRSDPLRKNWGVRREPALIHFITSDKPWTSGTWHPWAGAYWDVLRTTPFADEVIQRYDVNWMARVRINLRYWLSRFR